VRDVERLREKIELSLDDRQVVAVAVCALLLLAGVFSLGIVLGKRISSMQLSPSSAGDLAALDAQARKADRPAPAKAPHPEAPAKLPAPAAEKAVSMIPAPARQTMVVPPPPSRPAQVPPAAPITLTPPPRELGEYTVQVGASQDRAEAARMEARARSAGLKPYVMEANLGAKGSWYRVRLGAFRDKEAASRFRLDVERELRSAAVVMPTR
jgi:DedD protein